MIAKFSRFYGVSDQYVLELPAKRFFSLYEQLSRLQAEENLTYMRIVSQPFIDKEDTFAKSMKQLAMIDSIENTRTLDNIDDMKSFGIKYKKEDIEKGFEFS